MRKDSTVKEHLDLLLIYISHGFWRNGDLVAILVRPFFRNLVHPFGIGAMIIKNAQVGQI